MQHLGRIAVRGKRLGEYALWRVNLPENREPDGMNSCPASNANDLGKALDAFRFVSESPEAPSKASRPLSFKAGLADGESN